MSEINENAEIITEEKETPLSVIKSVYEQRLADKDKEIERLKQEHAKEIKSILMGDRINEEKTEQNLTFEDEVKQLLNKKFKL